MLKEKGNSRRRGREPKPLLLICMHTYLKLTLCRDGKRMSRRSRTELIIDILTEALSGTNKTKIMYRANLNFLRLKRYFSELESKGLIEVLDNPGRKDGVSDYRKREGSAGDAEEG